MHKRNWLLLVLFSCVGHSFVASADSVDVTFPVEAAVFASIQLAVEQNMSFGQEDVVSTDTDIPSTQPTKILASADANAAVTGSFGTSTVSLTCQSSSCNGSPAIAVDTFTCSGSGFNANCTGVMGSTAEATISINSIMHLMPAHLPGTYTGTQTFNLAYS